VAEVTASVDVTVGGSAAGGLVMNASQSGAPAMLVWYVGNRVEIRRYTGSTTTALLSQASVSGVPNGSSVTLSATYENGVYTVEVNGQTVLSYALSPADRGVSDVQTYVGVVMFDGNGSNRLDTFQVVP
jgi:hypothetical protein